MKQIIEISYSELRNITDRIIDLIINSTGYNRSLVTISTAINNQMGVQGDDWDSVLIALQEKERLLLEGLNFYDYFYDEGQLAEKTFKGLMWYMLRLMLYVILFKWVSIRFNDFQLKIHSRKPDLTIGDLITSKIEGKFVKRKERIFKIINCAK